MTPTETEKRVLIAAHFGWKAIPSERPSAQGHLLGWDDGKEGGHVAHIPNYFHSLDAMHEAEKAIPASKRVGDGGYMDHLWTVTVEDGAPRGGCTWDVAHATAAQRAEAFGRTMNLWPKPPSAPAR